MAIIKCKMCGGDLNLVEGASTAECEFCGSVQTVPQVDDEKKLIQFERAERLRKQCEFDKAAGIYETIVADFRQEAEAYWGLVLCKYGIEYVDDPATGKKIPTCHRSSFDSIMEDSDFEQTLENADGMARRVYREEAKQIEEIRKGIISVSSHEQPYDIFICYKETDEKGDRTLDSVLAQDIYDALTDKGYQVFFSRITLEDKLGQEYEPYIFAALNSAKIMLVFGTDYEYFNAVWVKNEWSRFLKLMAKDKQKHLIPCFKGIDAYDMPKEFAKLQAQDLGKVGATQDLLRGIEKILPKQSAATVAPAHPTVTNVNNPTVASYLKRVFLFLEDGKWEDADEYCEKVLDIDPENAQAYLGKLMAERKIPQQAELANQTVSFEGNSNYQKALRFADDHFRTLLEGYRAAVTAHVLADEKQQASVDEMRGKRFRHWISGGSNFTVGLRSDGTVEATKFTGVTNLRQGPWDVKSWRDIVAVSAGDSHTVGLRSDGTVVAVGDLSGGQCSVSTWKDIIEISAGTNHTVGLRRDGTVVSTDILVRYYRGQNEVSDWHDITAISAGNEHTVGLRRDGTVVATKHTGKGPFYCRQCDVSQWRDMTAISAGSFHTVGLCNDGTVVAVGNNTDGRCNVDSWQDIVAISAGPYHTVGLRRDGTVVAVGENDRGQCNVSQWQDIVAISAGASHTVGLRCDGTVVATKMHKNLHVGQCDVEQWKLFDDPHNLEKEREAAQKKLKEADQQAKQRTAQWRTEGKCQHCGSVFKMGLFSTKCVSCGKPKDY